VSDKSVKIKIEVDSSDALKALRGVSQAAAREEKTRENATRGSRRRMLTDAEKAAAAEQALLKKTATEVQRVERQKMRDVERSAKAKIREVERAAQAEIKAGQRAARELEKSARAQEAATKRRNRVIGGAVLGGAAGAATYGYNRLKTASSSFGFRTQDELIQESMSNQKRSAFLSSQTGMSTGQLGGIATSVSKKYGMEQSAVIDAMERTHAAFSNLPEVANNIDTYAKIARGSNATMEDTVMALGEMQRQFGLTSEETQQMGFVMADMSNKGSIEFADVATNFKDVLGDVVASSGLKGKAGATQALGLIQIAAKGGKNAAEGATSFRSTMNSFADTDVRKGLMKQGIRVTKNGQLGGELNDPVAIFRQMAANKKFQDPVLMGKIFTDMRARQGAQSILTQFRNDPTGSAAMLAGNGAAGSQLVDRNNAALDNTDAGRLEKMKAEQLATFAANSKNLAGNMMSLISPIENLKAEFPLLTTAAGAAAAALAGVAAAGLLTGGKGAVLGRIGGMASGAAGSLGLGGLAAAGATGVGAASAGMIAGAAALGTLPGIGLHYAMKDTSAEKALMNFGAGEGEQKQSGRGLFGGGTPSKPFTVTLDAVSTQRIANSVQKANPDRRFPGGGK
jgi:hypothetical protein